MYCIRPKNGKYGREYIEEQFRGVALETVRCKEPANTRRALDPLESGYHKMSGWIVLNADCMIFVDAADTDAARASVRARVGGGPVPPGTRGGWETCG